jgi:hypothetical protein
MQCSNWKQAMTILEEKMLKMITDGFTHHVDIGKGDDAIIFYENATTMHMRLPGASSVMHGTCKMLPDGYIAKWVDGPEGKWQISAEPGAFYYIGPDGKRAGHVTSIVPGNSANLN